MTGEFGAAGNHDAVTFAFGGHVNTISVEVSPFLRVFLGFIQGFEVMLINASSDKVRGGEKE